MPRIRAHQHVNPLAPYFRAAPQPVDIAKVFARPSNPLHLDLGSARGRFLLQMAAIEPEWNFLGVEIREQLVTEANRVAHERGAENLHFVFCNAMLWLDRLLADVPAGLIEVVTIHFPDPWFKKKHAKRRMVTPELIAALAAKLAPVGRVFFQTDIEFLFDEVCCSFVESGDFIFAADANLGFPVKTERERAVEAKDVPVFRQTFKKK